MLWQGLAGYLIKQLVEFLFTTWTVLERSVQTSFSFLQMFGMFASWIF